MSLTGQLILVDTFQGSGLLSNHFPDMSFGAPARWAGYGPAFQLTGSGGAIGAGAFNQSGAYFNFDLPGVPEKLVSEFVWTPAARDVGYYVTEAQLGVGLGHYSATLLTQNYADSGLSLRILSNYGTFTDIPTGAFNHFGGPFVFQMQVDTVQSKLILKQDGVQIYAETLNRYVDIQGDGIIGDVFVDPSRLPGQVSLASYREPSDVVSQAKTNSIKVYYTGPDGSPVVPDYFWTGKVLCQES